MEKVLFDTSVWINYNRNISNRQTDLLDEYINFHQNLIYITPTIIQEYLMGLKYEQEYLDTEEKFLYLNILSNNWLSTAQAAAKLYFNLRKKGVTIRKSTDCLIAATAIHYDLLLVHNDSDFDLIAQNSDLRVY